MEQGQGFFVIQTVPGFLEGVGLGKIQGKFLAGEHPSIGVGKEMIQETVKANQRLMGVIVKDRDFAVEITDILPDH